MEPLGKDRVQQGPGTFRVEGAEEFRVYGFRV